MITHLPFQSFAHCAETLDKKRCFRQLIDAGRILSLLKKETVAYHDHPFVRMWYGYIDYLQWYYNVLHDYCKDKHSHKLDKLPKPILLPKYMKRPIWCEYEPLYKSHQTNLLKLALNDATHGKMELSENLARMGVFIQNYNLNEELMWPVDEQGRLISEIQEWKQ